MKQNVGQDAKCWTFKDIQGIADTVNMVESIMKFSASPSSESKYKHNLATNL